MPTTLAPPSSLCHHQLLLHCLHDLPCWMRPHKLLFTTSSDLDSSIHATTSCPCQFSVVMGIHSATLMPTSLALTVYTRSCLSPSTTLEPKNLFLSSYTDQCQATLTYKTARHWYWYWYWTKILNVVYRFWLLFICQAITKVQEYDSCCHKK